MNWIWHFCLTNMKQRGARTMLTILGVVIGVISIVALLAIGIGVKETLLNDVMKTENVKTIVVSGVNGGKRKDKMLTDRKIEEFKKINHVASVYPSLNLDGQTNYLRYTGYAPIEGVPQEYLDSKTIVFGQMPDGQSLKPELLVGQTAMYWFFNDNTGAGYMDQFEGEDEEHRREEIEKIDLTNQKFEVRCGYDETAVPTRMRVAAMLSDNDTGIYCNMELLKRYLKKQAQDGVIPGQPVDANGDAFNEWIYSKAYVEVDEIDNVDYVLKVLRDAGFETENEKEYLDSTKKITKIAQLLLGAIGMIALLVAVIGIGNTMTTSVYDRLKEIGILKVLGCDPDELLNLFLLEAGILGGIGGAIGVFCSYGVAYGINKIGVKLLKLELGSHIAVIPWWLAVGAIVFAIVLGVCAGFFPAKFAAKLKPIDAIRQQ